MSKISEELRESATCLGGGEDSGPDYTLLMQAANLIDQQQAEIHKLVTDLEAKDGSDERIRYWRNAWAGAQTHVDQQQAEIERLKGEVKGKAKLALELYDWKQRATIYYQSLEPTIGQQQAEIERLRMVLQEIAQYEPNAADRGNEVHWKFAQKKARNALKHLDKKPTHEPDTHDSCTCAVDPRTAPCGYCSRDDGEDEDE